MTNLDLNYLFFRQQIERERVREARSETARTLHMQLARCYEEQIAQRSEGRVTFPLRFAGDTSREEPR
jgi:hypothetical protein